MVGLKCVRLYWYMYVKVVLFLQFVTIISLIHAVEDQDNQFERPRIPVGKLVVVAFS